MKKSIFSLLVILSAVSGLLCAASLSVDRIQVVVNNGKTTVDYTLVDADGNQVADGTLTNFTPSQTAALLTECKAKVLELFDTKYKVTLDANEKFESIVASPTYTVKFDSDSK